VTLLVPVLFVAGVALTQTSAAVQQQPPQQPNAARGQAMGPAMMGRMVNEGQASTMMAERQQMMANMKALDKTLDDLVAKMNAARGTEKVDAIAAVVKEIVVQRTQMNDRMPMMQARMMGHMMEHMMSMQGGMMSMMGTRGQMGATQAMADCPVMKALEQEAVTR
jgi:alpha-galactosidase